MKIEICFPPPQSLKNRHKIIHSPLPEYFLFQKGEAKADWAGTTSSSLILWQSKDTNKWSLD